MDVTLTKLMNIRMDLTRITDTDIIEENTEEDLDGIDHIGDPICNEQENETTEKNNKNDLLKETKAKKKKYDPPITYKAWELTFKITLSFGVCTICTSFQSCLFNLRHIYFMDFIILDNITVCFLSAAIMSQGSDADVNPLHGVLLGLY